MLLPGPYPQSAHPYAHPTDDTQTYTAGVANLYVRFDPRTLFYPYSTTDYFSITDGSGTPIPDSEPAEMYVGAELAGRMVTIPGGTGHFHLHGYGTDGTAWGYKVLAIHSVLAISDDAILPVAFYDGSVYSYQFHTAGAGTATWTLASGSLPPGTSLSGSGLLSGIITAVGVYTFSLTATSGADSDTVEFTLTVGSPGPLLALNTFTFKRIWFSYRDLVTGAWTENGLYADSTDVGGFENPGESVSAGIESPSNLGNPRGVLAHGAMPATDRGYPWFLGQGRPDPAYPVKIDNLDTWSDSSTAPSQALGMLQYWDMSHGAWWIGGKYWALLRWSDDFDNPFNTPRLCMVKSVATVDGDSGFPIPTLWSAADHDHDPRLHTMTVACRWDGESTYIDLCCQHAGSTTEYALYTFDTITETWGSAYGVLDFEREIRFATCNSSGQTANGLNGNQIFRFPNDDIGIVYTDNSDPLYGLTKLYSRLYRRATNDWGDEVVIDDPTAAGIRVAMGQMVPDPAREALHVFPTYYNPANGTWTGKYHIVRHDGTVTQNCWVFPTYKATDGFGHGLTLSGNVWVPYDDCGSGTTGADHIESAALTPHGNGYAVGDTGYVAGMATTVATYVITAVGPGGIPLGVTITDPGTGYGTGLHPTGSTSGSGTGLVFDVLDLTSGGGIFDLTFIPTPVGNGVNYHVGDTGTVTGGDGTASYVITSVDSNGGVTGFELTSGGSGYTAGTATTSSTSGTGVGFTIDILTTGSAVPSGHSAQSNLVWWGLITGGGTSYNPEELPKPLIETGNVPSCAYLIYSRAYLPPPPPVRTRPHGFVPQYIKRRNLFGH
jgi:hypothetical protein